MEELIIHTVAINRSAEIKHFEIPLSNNAKQIIGLWYKIRLLDNVTPIGPVIRNIARSTYVPEVVVGQLSLSSNQREGVFFFGDLLLEDTNQGYLDFTNSVFNIKPHSHAKFGQNLKVQVDADTSIVHGFISDNWGVISARNVRYEVDIYIYQAVTANN